MYTRDATVEFLPQSSGARLSPGTWFVILAAFHVVLGVAMHRLPVIGQVHAWCALTFALYLGLTRIHPSRVIAVCFYITGSEVLWRMCQVPIRWEFGKLALIAIAVVAILRRGYARLPVLPLLYVALLTPSVVLTMADGDILDAVRTATFCLAGPAALFFMAWLCSHCRTDYAGFQRVIAGAALPAFAMIGQIVWTLAGRGGLSQVVFSNESNFATSGGFGPNQVSAAMAFAALIAWFACLLAPARARAYRWLLFASALLFTAQCLITFSRTGLYLLVLSVGTSFAFMARTPRARMNLVVGLLLAVLTLAVVVVPALDYATGGAFMTRFTDTNDSHRSELAWMQLRIWFDHPLFGVGPGESLKGYAAHTEYTRMVAEHGWFGMLSLMMLAGVVLHALTRPQPPTARAMIAGLVAFGLAYMVPSATRMVVPAACIGIGYINIIDDSARDTPPPLPVLVRAPAQARALP
ncbi:MAG: O-antigen ligase family protein [Planctomycetota bacterium]